MKSEETRRAFDYLGNELCVGDPVVTNVRGYSYFRKGRVYKITPKRIMVEYNPGDMKVCFTEQITKIFKENDNEVW